MLATVKFPRISFRSTNVTRLDGSHFLVEGTLTIRDVAKSVSISATVAKSSKDTLSIEGKADLRLTDFGLKPPKAALGAVGTKDEMIFQFAVTAVVSGHS
jgi:polyisoprenoid-binding protein YceI